MKNISYALKVLAKKNKYSPMKKEIWESNPDGSFSLKKSTVIKPLTIDTEKVNRVEVIDWTLPVEKGGGRCYVKWEKGIKVWLDLQDNDKTLKIFIEKK